MTSDDARPAFLPADGESAARIASLDWSRTSLGEPANWPATLKSMLATMLSSPQPMFMAWGDDLLSFFNDAYAPKLGAKLDSAMGRPFADLWSEVWPDIQPLVAKALAGEGSLHENMPLTMTRNGYEEQTWWSFSYAPLRDEAGKVAGMLCVTTETTGVMLAERRLRRSEASAAEVLEGMAECVVILDGDFRVVHINPAALSLEDRPREAILGRTHWDAWPGSKDSRPGRLYRQAMADREPVSFEHCFEWTDGRRAWVEMRAYPLGGGLALFYRDITDRKTADDRLRHTQRRLNAVLDNASVAIFLMDARQHCAYMNAAAERLTGFTFAETQGRPLHDVIHHTRPDGTHFPLEECAIDRAFPENANTQGEETFVHKDGHFYSVAFTASPIRDEESKTIGTIIEVRDISAEKAAEMQLRKARAASDALAAEQAAILGQLAEGVVVTDPGGRITFVNEAAERLHGVKRLDVEPDSYTEVYQLLTMEGAPHPPQDLPLARAVLRGETVQEARWRIRRPDGTEVVAIGSARPIVGLKGERLGAVLTLRDDTMRKQAEDALRESEARFQGIVNSVDQMIWSTRPDGFHDFYNVRWYEFTGVPYGSTYGQAWNGMFHADDQERARARWRHCLETGEPYHIEYRLRHHSGQYRWVLGRAQPVRDVEGRIVRWFGTCTDIQEIVEAREVLARSSAELERLVAERTAERDSMWRVSQDLFAVVEADGTITAVNAAWTELLGWVADELVGLRFTEFTHPDDLEITFSTFLGVLEAPLTRPYEFRFRHKDGSYRWFGWTGAYEDGRVYANGRHTTPEREQAEALAQAEGALRQSQKMEVVGQLTGGVAHDFNNLLQIVTGNLDILQRNLPEDAVRLRRAATSAMTGASRAAALTQRLLAFSRRQPLDPKPISVNRLVTDMSELLERTLGETIDVETILAGGLWQVEADPNQLESAILNLAVNARDAMPEGGKLTIETCNSHLDRGYATLNNEVIPGQYVVICVSDTGTGMDKDTLGRVFEPFFTTKEVGKGTGLGLSQVYGYVKQSGGNVKLYSEVGEGTTVKIYLPRLMREAQEEPAPVEPGAPEGCRTETILVLEDDDDVRAYSAEVLRDLGYRVIEARDGPAALRLLDDPDESVQLLFSDVVLPGGMTGAVVAERAKVLRPSLKVLFTTGYARNAIVHQGRLDPGVHLITKPFSYGDLAGRIRDLLDGQG